MRMAGAAVIPFEYWRMARTIRAYLADLEMAAGMSVNKLQLGSANAEVKRMDVAARRFEDSLAKVMAMPAMPVLAEVNQAIYQVDQALLLRSGLPGRPWYKNAISAPGLYTGYGAKTLPGIREAMEAWNFEVAARQARALGRILQNVTARIDAATHLLDEAAASTSR